LLHRSHVRRRLRGRSALSTTCNRLKQNARRRGTHADLLTQSLPPSGPGHAHRRDRPSRVLSSPATTV
ncbi:hypothetical protein E4U50_001129, partial [Claviceps purpurea]